MKLISKRPTPVRARALTAIGVGLCCLSMVFPVSNVLAEERPSIRVSFEFEGQLFDRIPLENREDIKGKAEEKVCELAEERWGFLDWTNDQSAADSAAAWKVKLKVDIRQITNDAGNQVPATIATLSHAGELAANEVPFRQTPINEEIYPIGRMIPFTDPTALDQDIEAQLVKQLDTLLVSDKVRIFLYSIPIAETVIADAEKARLVVPLKSRDLRTDVDSKLRVKFKRSDNWSGWLDLETAKEVSEEGQHSGYVIGELVKVRIDPFNFPTPTPWNDHLSTVVESASEIKVYMEEYNASLVPGPVVGDGIAGEPDE